MGTTPLRRLLQTRFTFSWMARGGDAAIEKPKRMK
jgi:hypothetical protein